MDDDEAYTYRVEPFIGRLPSGGRVGEVSGQLQAQINRAAAKGWDFHSVTAVTIEVRPGCLASLLGRKSNYVRYDQIVFRCKMATIVDE